MLSGRSLSSTMHSPIATIRCAVSTGRPMSPQMPEASQPPSTRSSVPVTKRAASEAR
jgi:hypothetical protein